MKTGHTWADKFEIRDPFVTMQDGYEIPRFLWERMDPVAWHALQETPGALEVYLENSTKEGVHDPYTITVWKGNTATEYFFAENNLLAAPPQTRTLDVQPLFGRFSVRIEDEQGRTLTGTGSQNYEKVDAVGRKVLTLALEQTGKNEFITYSIDGRVRSDGTVQIFNGNFLASGLSANTKRKIQEIINDLRNKRPISLHVQETTTFGPDGKTIIRKHWVPDDIKRPTPRERQVIEMKTIKKVFNKNAKGKVKELSGKKTARIQKRQGTNSQKRDVVYDYSQRTN